MAELGAVAIEGEGCEEQSGTEVEEQARRPCGRKRRWGAAVCRGGGESA
jgi:hypothetical protein